MIPGADTSPARLAGKMREKEVASQTIRTPARRAASQWRRSWMRRDGQPRSGAHAAQSGGEHYPGNRKAHDTSHLPDEYAPHLAGKQDAPVSLVDPTERKHGCARAN